ncbi:MAG: GGDEF domain-containing protein [Alphaproteobacteria bacterium]|nr:GGDEF domain-containing protein [Alphaproteobacteria bacterium]
MSTSVTRLFSPLRKLLGYPQQPHDQSVSVLLLRLENMQVLASVLDKVAVNHLLVQLSMSLGRAVRLYDPVRVLAPDLYAVVLHNRTDREAMQVARRLHQQGQVPLPLSGQTVTPVLTGALVHAEAPDLPTVEALLDSARQHLALVEDAFLGRLGFYPHDPSLAGARLAATVTDAIEADQVQAWFQPQVCCHSGRVTGFEALARWQHPQRGLLMPGAFMPHMSEADHNNLTMCMVSQSVAALKTWDKAGFNVPTVSINISSCELSDRGFADCLLWELDRHDIPPARLVVEVLESVGPVTSNAETRTNLAKLSKAGCRIDLDDFGTGYASLDAIRQFGIHRIKIDRSFVVGCDHDEGQQRMILAILALTERLGISALAEGVETREEHSFLAQMGCDELQGYAIGRPMPLDLSLDFLAENARQAARLPGLIRRG